MSSRVSSRKKAFSISGADQSSEWIGIQGDAMLVLRGTWSAIVHIQRTTDNGETIDDVTDNNGNVKTISANVT